MFYAIKVLLYIEALLAIACVLFRFSLAGQYKRLVGPAELAIVFATPAIALLLANRYIYLAWLFLVPVMSAGNGVAMGRRYLLLLSATPFLSTAYVVNGIYIGFMSSITFLNLGLLVGLLLTRRKQHRVSWPVEVGAWAMLFTVIVMNARGLPIGGTIRETVLAAALLLPSFYLATRIPRSVDDLSQLVLFFVFGAFCNAVVAVYETTRHWPLYEAFNHRLDIPLEGLTASLALRAGLLRASGPVANYEVLGLLCGMALICLVGLRRYFSPTGWLTALAVIGLGLVAAQARSAWIVTLIGLLVYFAASGKWRGFARVLTAGVAAGAGLYALSFVSERVSGLLGMSGHAQETFSYRTRLAQRGWEEFKAHPLFGQTRKGIEVTMNDLRQGDHIIDFVNAHLFTALMGGIGLFAIWVAAWWLPFMAGWRVRSRGAGQNQLSPPVALGLIAACAADLLFTSAIDRVFTLIMLSFGIAGALVVLQQPGRTAVRPREKRRRLLDHPLPAEAIA